MGGTASPLPYIVAGPGDGAGPRPLVVCLHGFGADKSDLTGLARVLGEGDYRFVFPDGPRVAFDGADPTARAWYERGGDESPAAVADALAALDGFLAAVTARFGPPPAAVLLGFSQGGAMALRYGLPRPDTFAGLAVLSGSLRRLDDLTPTLPAERGQRVFVSHGRADALVPVATGRAAVEFLRAAGYRPEYREDSAGHHLTPACLADLRAWLRATLPEPR